MNKSILIIELIILISSCRKDIQPEIDEPANDTACYDEWCEDIPPPTSMIGWQTVKSGSQYCFPEFNPNNPDEFIYIRDNGSGTTELVKYSLNNNEETVLCNSLFIIKQPQWGKMGWITFSTSSWKVWKIYEDGSQLTQLTFGDNDQAPHFNLNGDQIYYDRGINYSNFELDQNPDLYKEHKIIIIDLNGIVIDSVMANDPIPNNYFVKWHYTTIQGQKIYFVGGTNTYYGIYELTINDNTIQPVHLWSIANESILAHTVDFWDNNVYYTKFRKGIFKTDVVTGIETQIKIGCGMRYYDAISISPDGSKMLMEKVTTTVLNDNELDEQREIWLLDLNDPYNSKQILGE